MTWRPDEIPVSDLAEMQRLKSEAGLTHGQIARRFNMPVQRVRRALKGIPSAHVPNSLANKADLDRALEDGMQEAQKWLREHHG